jgi:Domain of unknown function (DUF4783)
MKQLMVMVGMVLSLSSFLVAGDSDKIISALNQGNAGQFSGYFDNFLDIKLPEKDEIKNVGKTQATITVKSFFDDIDVKGFEKTSQREMGGTMYLTGKLKGASKTYNITLLMKDRGDKLSIISIRIS